MPALYVQFLWPPLEFAAPPLIECAVKGEEKET
jgi:hypothetical protein